MRAAKLLRGPNGSDLWGHVKGRLGKSPTINRRNQVADYHSLSIISPSVPGRPLLHHPFPDLAFAAVVGLSIEALIIRELLRDTAIHQRFGPDCSVLACLPLRIPLHSSVANLALSLCAQSGGFPVSTIVSTRSKPPGSLDRPSPPILISLTINRPPLHS